MNRIALLSLAAAGIAVPTYFAGDVFLQDTTPGTAQNGHLNITGTAKAGNFVANSTAPSGVVIAGDFRTASSQGRGILGNASSATGATYGGLFQNASNGGRAVAGLATAENGTTYGGFFSSASIIGRAVYGQATAATGVNYGVYGKSDSPDGFGVFAEGNIGTTGVYFGNGSGITNLNPANLAGVVPDSKLPTNLARRDEANTFTQPQIVPNGTAAVPGLRVGAGAGLFSADGTALSLVSNGLERLRITSAGQVGINQAAPSALLHIVDGTAVGGPYVAGAGMILEKSGQPKFEIRSSGSTGGQIHFTSSAFASDFRIEHQASLDKVFMGSLGEASAITMESDPNFVGINQANPSSALHVTGTITGSTKNFIIDHPLDPYNKVLRHSCVESDEHKNIYDGTVKTDSKGYASITMPSWFTALNENFRYQLTVLDDGEEFVMAKVTRKLAGGSFTIRTSKPGIEVCWMITGERKDGYARANPLIVEEMKAAEDRGTLLNKESVSNVSAPRPKK